MEWLSQQGPLGALCLALVAVIRKLYADLMLSKENERQALLKIVTSELSEDSRERPTRESRFRGNS